MDDEVFKALADPNRRQPAGSAFRARWPVARRAAGGPADDPVRRHEAPPRPRGGRPGHDARVGREKLHYLNPVPIRLIHDRWISRYAEPIVAHLSALKSRLEAPMAADPSTSTRSTSERRPSASGAPSPTRPIRGSTTTDSDVRSDWKPGSKLELPRPTAQVNLDCKIIEIEPRRSSSTASRRSTTPSWRPSPRRG